MRLRIVFFLAFATIVCASTLAVFNASDRVKESKYRMVEDAVRHRVVDADSSPLVSRAIEILADTFPDMNNVVVNEIPKKHRIAVLVVDLLNINPRSDFGKLALRAKNNAISVGHKYVIVDRNLLGLLLLNASVTFGSEVQVAERSHANDADFTDAAIRRTFVTSRMLRLDNTYRQMIEGKNEWIQQQLETFSRLSPISTQEEYLTEFPFPPTPQIDYPILPLLVQTLSESPASEPFPFSDVIAIPFAAALAPILLHELGHLRTEYEGAFVGDFARYADDKIRELSRRQEMAADDFAVERIERAARQHPLSTSMGGYAFDLRNGLYTTGTMLEDIAFYSKFNRFREMNTQLIGSRIIYNEEDCSRSIRGFFDVDLIADVAEVLMPILTTIELKDLQRKDVARESAHGHVSSRSTAFLPPAVRQFGDIEPHSTFSSTVRRLLSSELDATTTEELKKAYVDDVARIYPKLPRFGVKIPTDYEDRLVSLGYRKDQAASCPFDNCWLFSNSAGAFIEFGIRNNSIVYASFYVRNFSRFPKQWDGAWQEETEYSNARHIANIATFLSMAQLFTDSIVVVESSSNSFFEKLHKCGFSGMAITSSKGMLTASSTDNDKSVFLSFVAR